MMKNYFRIQLRIFPRRIKQFGISPILFFILAPIILTVLGAWVYSKTLWAGYLIVAATLLWIAPLAAKERNEFLMFTFSITTYYTIRCIENLSCALLIVPWLLYFDDYALAGALVGLSILLALIRIQPFSSTRMATPFGDRLFEFAQGYRRYFVLYFLCLLIIAIAIYVDNFQMAIVFMAVLFLVMAHNYMQAEETYYVWCYAESVRSFMVRKLYTATLYAAAISLPIAGLLYFFFPENALVLILVTLLGLCFVVLMLLAKYAAYPERIGIPQGILIALSISFPVILPLIYWYFARQSHPRLKKYLG